MSDDRSKAEFEHVKVQSMDLSNPVYTHLHIAKLLTYSVKHVEKHVVKSNGFPSPVNPDSDSDELTYLRDDLMHWYLGHSLETPETVAVKRSVPTQLYRHWDSQGQLLYIGISISALTRLSGHRKTALWFKDISMVTIEHFDTTDEAESAEVAAIKAEKPIYNILHNDRKAA